MNDDKIDDLHVPHIKFGRWYSIHNENSEKAIKDKSQRKFGVRFFLEDPIAKTNYVYLKLLEDLSQNNDNIDIYFEKNKENLLQSVLIGLESTEFIEAFNKAIDRMFSILSMICFFYRRPAKIGLIIVSDIKHKAEYQTRNHAPQSAEFLKPLASFKSSPIGALFSIYRDGINSTDLPYRYICFFKIYEAWFSYTEKFFHISKADFKDLVITKNFLIGRYKKEFHENFIDKNFDDNSVYKDCKELRHYLTHPIIDRNVPIAGCINFDSIEFSKMLEAMVNLLEKIATKILNSALLLMAENDKEIERLVTVYKIDSII